MLARRAPLAALAALAALTTLAVAEDSELLLQSYVTVLEKGLVDSVLNESLGPFYIPNGQCSGVLDDLLRCPTGSVTTAVRVRVLDSSHYARAALADSLRSASVLRASPCLGEATVSVRLACLPSL